MSVAGVARGLAGPAACLAMALAVGLAGCQEEAIHPARTLLESDTADQVLEGVEFLLSTEGVRRTKVEADTAFLYEAAQLANLRKLTVTFFDGNGVETSTITADSGQYLMREGSMNAWGHVVATTPDGKRLRSEELRYDARNRRIWSDLYFTFDQGARHIEGTGFESDPAFRDIRAKDSRGRQRTGAGGIVLPGQ